MQNKLKEEIEYSIDCVPHGIPQEKVDKINSAIYSLISDVSVKFADYMTLGEASTYDFQEQITHTTKDHFDYFIQHIYKQ